MAAFCHYLTPIFAEGVKLFVIPEGSHRSACTSSGAMVEVI
jgi:hypothetical protein